MTPADQLALVQHAESLGYDSVWLGEAWGWEVFTRLTWIACHTTTIKLGAGIANVFSRSPALLAQTVATLDQISGGRVLLGLGTSGQAVVERWHGVPFEKGAQRLREYTEIIRFALSGERVNYDGEVFKISGFRLGLTPLRKQVPIYFASITPTGFRLTAELADGWLPIWMGPEYIERTLTKMNKSAGLDLVAAATEGKSDLGLVAGPAEGEGDLLHISDRGQGTADQAGPEAGKPLDVAAELHTGVSRDPNVRDLARAHLARYIGGMGSYYHRLVSDQGFEQKADAIKAAYAGHEREKALCLVTDEMLDSLTVAGDRDWCRSRLAAYRKAGVTLPLLNFLDGLTSEEVRETIEALA
jgi:alkanesulfonate monooxygenase SsuD/methylene tetrahydromethanopterin reductase-like flavin-dependent oxidoreductase (luciferase family)